MAPVKNVETASRHKPQPSAESLVLVERVLPKRSLPQAAPPQEYLIGIEDELHISVYGSPGLEKTQVVRPDGKIAFPLVGEVQANGRTPDQLREQLWHGLTEYIRKPQVAVIITEYRSRKVKILGQVRTPGLIMLVSDVDLLEGLSRAGGLTEDADLSGAFLVRGEEILPVDFEKLLTHGDLTQNVLLKPQDFIFIPHIDAKKAFVFGEVRTPLALALKHNVTLVESISMAGGFTPNAEQSNVLILRGGPGDPKILTADIEAMTKNGEIIQNIPLEPHDIVYVPKTRIANIVEFAENLRKILSPIINIEEGILLSAEVERVLTDFGAGGNRPIAIVP